MNLCDHSEAVRDCFHSLRSAYHVTVKIAATHSPMPVEQRLEMYRALDAVRDAIKNALAKYEAMYAKNAAAELISSKIAELKETA